MSAEVELRMLESSEFQKVEATMIKLWEANVVTLRPDILYNFKDCVHFFRSLDSDK